MKSVLLAAILTPMLLVLGACGSRDPQPSSMKGDDRAASRGAFYAEEMVEGRIYVFGTTAVYDLFKKSHQKPGIAKTYIGAGPAGETVLLEADAKTSELQDRLRSEFNRRHSLHLE